MASHEERVKWIDHRAEVLAQMNANGNAALQAMGQKAVQMIVDQMNRYPKRIYQTGDLQRDVAYQMTDQGTLIVGNSMDYAIAVHEGHMTKKGRFVPGRPYIRDAIEGHEQELMDTAAPYLKHGF